MCGIAGIVLKKKGHLRLKDTVASMSKALSHRGPDGEGFLIQSNNQPQPFFGSVQKAFQSQLAHIPKQHITVADQDAYFGFAHRRLSIIDLSDAAHQPMCSSNENIWITFNGEIYNYLELKAELIALGHYFNTESDTEVVIASYAEWGADCVNRFNGMWAFCIYDVKNAICFASRDRLGVKPFYYINNEHIFSFASEQKAFVRSGLIKAQINKKALHNYLVNGNLESDPDNFFEGISELFPGHNLVYSLKSGEVEIKSYFSLDLNLKNDALDEDELIGLIRDRLVNAVNLRLRSDVEVGTCLSGGIDSSVLSGITHTSLKKQIHCFTSVFKGQAFNEEQYADLAASFIKADHKKVEPTLTGFLEELDELIYSQDVPIWDTSTYAQYKVMELAKKDRIKVVLDGQGADELFAGYHHHYVAKWNNLLKQGKILAAQKDMLISSVTINNPFLFYAKEKVKQRINISAAVYSKFLNKDFVQSYEMINPVVYFETVNEQLRFDIEHARLKSFLKCEDRCGMWHSVESRTPFSDDVSLIELMFSFNGNKKIKNGVSKYLLREACKDVLPKEIYARYDKKGFETPMMQWVTSMKPLMLKEVKSLGPELVNLDKIDEIDEKDLAEMRLLFKLFVIARWKKVFSS